ncbi:MAG TPA: hypothetical protein VMH88_01930 [Gemmatimonadales bacterium]|nr:hypothetical protein [Gemmatimonadales bacterium]
MIPTWTAVVGALSLVIVALCGIAVAVATAGAVVGFRAFLRAFEHVVGPAVDDVRQLVGNIRREADSLVGTSRDIRLRIVRAADAAEQRLQDLDALVDVVQEEVEDAALDVAATVRNVRRGFSIWRVGSRVLRRRRGATGERAAVRRGEEGEAD